MRTIKWFAILNLLLAPVGAVAQQTISLEGLWDLSLGDSTRYDDSVVLPGSLLTNGKGDDVTVDTRWTGSLYDSSYYRNPYMEKYRVASNIKLPFFLTPKKHYVGTAWYRRTVYVPDSWEKKRITLFLERPHIETTVFVNGQMMGHRLSLSTPHEYDLTRFIKVGERNEIVVAVYNGIENVGVGQDSHSVTDQTQGNWNGIAGRMELRAQPKSLSIRKVRLQPYPRMATVHLEIDLDSPYASAMEQVVVALRRADQPKEDPQVTEFTAIGGHLSADMAVWGELALWDEFHPNLYQIGIEAGDDYYETTFGLREVTVKDRDIYLNGHPIWLRGTVENCCFPETGYPPTDEESWSKIFSKCREYGLNHMRFHSYCPPEAAFAAADKAGFYLQVEGPTWPNHGVKLRAGQKIDQYLIDESKRIIDAYGHHPSFMMMAAGNEPAGDWVGYCSDWVKVMKQYDPTKIYCGASVGGGWAWDEGSEYHVKGGARGLDWNRQAPHSDDDYYDQIERPRNYDKVEGGRRDVNNSPIIAHEQGQWCAFPDFKEIPQYTGVYQPRNFEIFRDLLADNGMELQAEKFLKASGKLQTLAYKYEIERNLRTKDYTGFQLLGLNDYSGQGTALVGVLNVHWQEKGYTDAEEWTEFCWPIVPLAKFPKFVYTSADTLKVPVEIYNAMYGDIGPVRKSYFISRGKDVLAGGSLSSDTIHIGKGNDIGTVVFPLDSITKPSKLTLTVMVGRFCTNHWDFWVYPERSSQRLEVSGERLENTTQGLEGASDTSLTSNLSPLTSKLTHLYISDTLDAKALDVLKAGGKVLLTAAGKVRLGSDVVQHYLPVFWNTSWFKMRPPHTTGAYIDSSHLLFRHDFPTDDWSNLNWWELLNRAQVMNLMEFPKDYQPPIQPIDTWHVSRKLGMLVEANVLKGKLLMTTMDISSQLDNRVVARQMRHAILSYMQSDDFQPTLTLDPQVIANLFTKEGPKVDMFTNESPDELKPKIK